MQLRTFCITPCFIGLLGLLASCQLDATITIVGTGTKPEFIVDASGGTTCIDRLLVHPVNAKQRNPRSSWGIGRIFGRGDADCRSRVTYGQMLPGYETDMPPQALIAGERYRVEAHGGGWTVAKEWTPE